MEEKTREALLKLYDDMIIARRANTLEGIQKIGLTPEPEDTENYLMGDYNNEEG